VGIHFVPPPDADNDGLPDVWENFYFGTLTNVPPGDPDGDLLSNAYEFLHGTDPTVYNDSGDTDNDGLPDVWETAYFSSLSYGAGDDPDRDGFTNLQEYVAGSNPTNPNSIVGDINGNNLSDAWETNAFGGWVASAYDDPDGDGYNNLAEMVWSTHPTNAASHPYFISPRVAFLRDSVVATNACLMPSAVLYGRAINGLSFQKDNILLTFGGYQYSAWYDTVGTVQSVWLARRSVTNTSAGAWEKVNTGSLFTNGDETAWDAHNVIAIGICPADGTLHLAWDHHNHPLRYRRSVVGLGTTNQAAWGTNMLNPEQNWLVTSGQTESEVTYPQFTITPAGGLVLNRRTGGSGNGDQLFYFYHPITNGTGGKWSGATLFLSRNGTYNGSTSRCAYINGFDFGPDGKIHVTWTWREGAGTSNHDICYAYSEDNGVTWRNNAGTTIADTRLGQSINLNTPGIVIKPKDLNQLLINNQAQCIDQQGRVHVLMLHRREEAAYVYPNLTTAAYATIGTAYYHYFRDPATGAWSQRRIPVEAYPVGSRPKIGFDAAGNLFAVFVSYTNTTVITPGYTNGKLVVASASQASQYTDWEIVQVVDLAFDGEPLLDQRRLLADNLLSVYLQEHSASTSVVGTPLHLFDFAVNVTPSDALALDFFGPDVLISFNAAAGTNYQLQSTTTLSPADWTDTGAVVTNPANGLLALPEPNGRNPGQRFYRVLAEP
jgi:hypothetical protein